MNTTSLVSTNAKNTRTMITMTMSTRSLGVIMLLGLAFRIAQLNSAQFWYDEAFTGWVASLDFGGMMHALAGDVHPPLYYLIAWSVTHLTRSEWALRLPSVLFGTATLYLAWRAGDRLNWPKPATLLALVFMAVSPAQIHFSQENRMYSLLQFLFWLGMVAVLERRWVLLGLATAGLLYTHNYGLFYAPVLWLIGMGGEAIRPMYINPDLPAYYQSSYGYAKAATWRPGDESQMGRLTIAMLLAFVLWLPWAGVMLLQMGNLTSGYWIQPVTPGGVIYSLYMLFWGFAMPEQWQPAAVMLTAGLIVYTVWRLVQHNPPGWRALFMAAFMPLCLAVIASEAWQPVYLFRGLLPSSPALYLLAAWPLSRVDLTKKLYAGALIIPVLVAGLYGHYRYNPVNKGDTLSVVNQIRAEWQPGDIVYHITDGTLTLWSWYATDLEQYKAPPCGAESLGSLSRTTRRAMGVREFALENIEYNRAWIVWADGPTTSECEHNLGSSLIEHSELKLITRDDEYIYAGVWLYTIPIYVQKSAQTGGEK